MWEDCDNTGLTRENCRCLNCWTSVFRFKFLCIDCKNIDEVIEKLDVTLEYFKNLKKQGYRVDGPISDDYMELAPPYRVGFYWMACQECGGHYEMPAGRISHGVCQECRTSKQQAGTVEDEMT